jgi:hypothetical protein
VTTLVPAHFPAATSLSDMEALIVQNEAWFGPLNSMDHDSQTSIFYFDADQPSPANNAVVAPQKAGVPDIPEGSALVCGGLVFVAGQLTLCAATRPV